MAKKKNNLKNPRPLCCSIFVKESRNNTEGYMSCPSFPRCLYRSGVHPESREGKWESC